MSKGKRILSVLLVVAMLLALLPNAALAEEYTPVVGFPKVYLTILNSPAFSYDGMAKPVLFTNICGDSVPEMIVVNPDKNQAELQVWTCQNSEAKKLLSMDWTPISSSKYYLYKMSDGRLASYEENSEFVVDYSYKICRGVYYSADSNGVYSETGEFSYRYFQNAFGSTEFSGAEINGASTTETEVKAEEKKLLSGTLLFNSTGGAKGAMSVQDARNYLDGIVGSFFDVPRSSWYADAVEHCYTDGFMSGVTPTRFAPEQIATRAMLVQTLYKYYGGAVPDGLGTTIPDTLGDKLCFTDVPETAWYRKAVAWAFASHVVYGTSGTTFSPNSNVTREQAVTMIYNCYKVAHPEAVTDPAAASTFSDFENTSPWAKTAMAWAVNYGVIFGQDGKLNPQGTATRAQLAMMFKNYHTRRFTAVVPQ